MSMTSPTSRAILQRLVAFDTTSRNSNLPLLDYVEQHLLNHGVTSRRVSRPSEPKARVRAVADALEVEMRKVNPGHKPDEFVTLDQLRRCETLLRRL